MTARNVDVDALDEDPRVQLQESIADGLAALSEAIDIPTGMHPVYSAFSRGDVDFTTDAWTARLVEVQGWLAFGDDLPTSSRDALVEALGAALGLDHNDAVAPDGTLSLHALERLNQRTEVASRLQSTFLQELDADGTTRAAATQSWADAWAEEDVNGELISPEPVSAKADVWHIFQLTKKRLNLTPSYQRGDVWRSGDRQALIESILRGIPLPSIILLRTGGSTPHEVVDGKQRLTAILRFIGAHPVAMARVREASEKHGPFKYPNDATTTLEDLFREDYPAFRTAWKRLEGEPLTSTLEDTYYFPFKLRNNGQGGLVGPYLEPLQGKYYTQIRNSLVRDVDHDVELHELFEGAPDYKVPVIEYTSATQQQIHEVFRLYNKQGVHLNAEEIRNAIYHEIELTRATLFAAGDADPRLKVTDIANSLDGVADLGHLGETLRSYQFGVARYRRTKVLSWVISVLLNDTQGKPLTSTARHIDQLLERIQRSSTHRLRDADALASLFTWVARSAELHAAHEDDLFSPAFKDGSMGVKWQELQLVGSLVGIALAYAGAPDDIEDRIQQNAEKILDATKLQAWQRPEKTQTRTQWAYIARIAEGIAGGLGVNVTDASQAISSNYGSSGIESLMGMLEPANS